MAGRYWLIKIATDDQEYERALTVGKREALRVRKAPSDWSVGDCAFLYVRRRIVGLGQIASIEDGDFTIEHLAGALATPIGIDDLREDIVIGDAAFLKQGVTGTVFALEELHARRLGRLVARRQPTKCELLDGWFGAEAMRHKAVSAPSG